MRNREVLLTDGPHAETEDQIAGFDVIECPDLDEAIEVAAVSADSGRIRAPNGCRWWW